MSQLLKPTVCLAFILGGELVVMAVRIAFAIHATILLIARFLVWGKHFRVDITRQSVFVKCAIFSLKCCIHRQKNLRLENDDQSWLSTQSIYHLWIRKTCNMMTCLRLLVVLLHINYVFPGGMPYVMLCYVVVL